jgi:hypothetical protein
MPFASLATVELQLIMQCCDAKTLLSFARCSRATLQAASTDFAWSRQPPFPVRSTQAELGARIRGSLLRHCDIALTWGSASGGSGLGMRSMFAANISVPEAVLAGLESVPRLVTLDARNATAGPKQFARLLAHPSFSSLTALYVDEAHLDTECMRLLPLHQRGLRILHAPQPAQGAKGFLLPVAQLPLLEELRTTDLPGSSGDDVTLLGQCPLLRRLAIRSLRCEAYVPLLTAPGLRGLEELELEEVFAHHANGPYDEAAPVDWTACFANLRCLRSLRLLGCWGVDALIETLLADASPCPALRMLSVHTRDLIPSPSVEMSEEVQEAGMTVPSAPLVGRLLAARPLLHFALDVPPLRDYLFISAQCGDSESNDLHNNAWQSVHDDFAAVAAEHSGRVAHTLTSLGLDMDD